MKRKGLRNASALLFSLCMIFALSSAAMAGSTYAAKITGITVDETSKKVQSAQIEVSRAGEYTAYVAVYESDVLVSIDAATKEFATSDTSVAFEKGIEFDEATQTLRCFIWENNCKPVAEAYTYGEQPSDTEIYDDVIYLKGDSIDAAGVENVTVDGTTVTIEAAGEYTITGTLNDGQIAVNYTPVDNTETVTITLDGVDVTSTTGNAFNGISGTVTLVPTSKESTFTSSASADSIDTTAIYSKNDLTIKGDGKLNAISENGNGIRCKNDLEIGVCDLYVKAANNGIKGDESVKVTKKNNSITVESGGDGICSDNAPTIKKSTRTGTVTINGGTIDITTTTTTKTDGTVKNGDGIQADTLLTIAGGDITIDATGEALKSNFSHLDLMSTDGYDAVAEALANGDGCMVISGGTLDLKSGEDGIKAVKDITVSGGSVTLDSAKDGIQVNEIVYTDDTETEVSSYVPGSISISDGTLDITCSEDGIQCGTGDITISGGNITVNSVLDCIQSENILEISGGTFNLTAHGGVQGTSTDSSCKGLKAQNLIDVSGGTITLNTYDDSIHSNHTVNVSGGTITAATADDGVHGDSYLNISGTANINVTESYEGIEAAEIYISGGETRVNTSDDGANAAGDEPSDDAYNLTTNRPQLDTSSLVSSSSSSSSGSSGSGSGAPPMPGSGWGQSGPDMGGGQNEESTYGYLEISGGLLYIVAEGDGLDSNKDSVIKGGTVLVNGPTSEGNGVFDVGEENGGSLTISGSATVIGAGTSDMAVTPSSSTQYYVVASFGGSSSQGGGMGRPGQQQGSGNAYTGAFKLTNSAGDVVTYVPEKSYSWIFVSTPDMTSGSYTLYYNGSVTGGTSWVGNYAGTYGIVTGASYSGSTTTSLTATK